MNKLILVLSLCIWSLSTTAEGTSTGGVWFMVPGSNQKDFQIYCRQGTELIWGIYSRGGTSVNQVARDVYIHQGPDGRVLLSFKRGFLQADKETLYIPATGVSCEVTEK